LFAAVAISFNGSTLSAPSGRVGWSFCSLCCCCCCCFFFFLLLLWGSLAVSSLIVADWWVFAGCLWGGWCSGLARWGPCSGLACGGCCLVSKAGGLGCGSLASWWVACWGGAPLGGAGLSGGWLGRAPSSDVRLSRWHLGLSASACLSVYVCVVAWELLSASLSLSLPLV
jgi:hypothetical protein